MTIEIIQGDLLSANVDMIVHQTNTTTVLPHGLSASIKTKYPYGDVYGTRKAISRNFASIGSRHKAGTAVVLSPSFGLQGPKIACLMGQICPGKVGTYWCSVYGIDVNLDTKEMRLKYFQEALEDLQLYLTNTNTNVQTIGFPYMIGCGLAGGNWDLYSNILNGFADKLSNHNFRIVVYKL